MSLGKFSHRFVNPYDKLDRQVKVASMEVLMGDLLVRVLVHDATSEAEPKRCPNILILFYYITPLALR